jgi:hypothetical protein
MTAQRQGKSFPDIIAEAFALYVRNKGPYLGLGLIGAVLVMLLNAAYLAAADATDLKATAVGSKATAAQIAVLAGVFIGALTVYLVGEGLIVPAAFRAALGRRVEERRILAMLPARLPVLIAAALIFAVVSFALLFSVLLIPVAIYLMVRWSFLPQAVWSTETRRPLEALARSSRVVSGAWFRVAFCQLGIVLLGSLPELALSPISNVSNGVWLAIALSALAWLLAIPFVASATTLLYIDVLARKNEQLQTSGLAW